MAESRLPLSVGGMSFGILLVTLAMVQGQASDSLIGRAAPTATREAHHALNLGLFGTGVSVGNSAGWTGVRVNFRDAGVAHLNGVALTLWKAKQAANRDARINGLALGLVGPEAGTLRGISLGTIGVLAHHDMTGLNVGGGGLVSEGSLRGLNLGGLGSVSWGRTAGITAAGLAVFARGGADGVTVAPLAVVTGAESRGVTIGGLALIGDRGFKGINVGGLGVLSRGKVAGLNVGALGVVGQDAIYGVSVGGLAVSSRGPVGGITVAGVLVSSKEAISGITASLYRVDTKDLYGIAVAPYNRIRGEQRGLTIGIINSARELHGFQFGLLNHAGNNRGPFKWLPILNLHH